MTIDINAEREIQARLIMEAQQEGNEWADACRRHYRENPVSGMINFVGAEGVTQLGYRLVLDGETL